MRWAILLCFAGLGIPTAAAQTAIDLDLVYVSANGSPRLFDHFDDGALDTDWVTAGTPGPESGTTLRMDAGDLIIQSLIISESANWYSLATMDLTMFDAPGSAALMIMTGGPRNFLALGVAAGVAFLVDEGGLLGASVIDTRGGSASLALVHIASSDRILAVVNGTPLYFDDDTLGRPTGLAIAVVPEPASAGLIFFGAWIAIRRRWTA